MMNYPSVLICLIVTHMVVHAHYVHGKQRHCKTPYESCVQNLCCCTEEDAYCEGHGKRLRYIPKLPQKTKTVLFNGNHLPQLSKQVFSNISMLNLINLTINNDGVLSITDDAFTDLSGLQRLKINGNSKINKTELSLSFKSLTKINILSMYLKDIGLTTMIPDRFFRELKSSNIRHLHLDNNRLTYVNMRDFQYLQKLTYLTLTNNAIKVFTVDNGHPTLYFLNLKDNKIGRKQYSFCPSKRSAFPNLKKVIIDNNYIFKIDPRAWKCLSGLTQLRIGGNMIRHIPNNSIADLTSLREFWIDRMFESRGVNMKIDKLAFNSKSLQKLRLDANNIVFQKQHAQNNIFGACKGVIYLSIDRNNLAHISGDDITKMLSPLKQLRTLSMKSTHLRSLPKTLIKHFPKLKDFRLDANCIRDLGKSLVGPTNLTSLSFYFNNLRVLKPESFPLSMQKTLRSLDLAGNAFDCSCKNIWFLNWIGDDGKVMGTNISFKRWPNHYKCYSPKTLRGKLLKNVRPTAESCRAPFNLLFFLAPMGGILFMVIVSIPICIRYRWHILYMWYKLTKTRKEDERRPLLDNGGNGPPTQPYTYVIYHDSDRDFVHQALRNIVEEELGFKLYIWHRDAAHGSKANVMFDAIDSSSHVLGIISSTFVTDGWCEFQLEIGLEKKNEKRKDCLTLLLLDNLDRSLLRRSWCVTLVKNATVDWCSDQESVRSRVCLDMLKSRLSSTL